MSDEELKALVDAFRQKLTLDPEIRAAEKKIAEGKADFSDTSRMFWRRSELLGDYMQGIVPDLAPEDRERLAEALLRMGYNDTNGVLVPLQEALDVPLGVHLTPVVPKYPAERVATVAHALMDPTVPEEKIVRRAGAPVANVNMSYHDKFMEENARIRAKLGMKPTITRYGSGCCKWCSEVAGRYSFGDQPKDIFRRHDNCGCTIIYDNQVMRGAKTEGGGRSRAWEEVDPAEVLRNASEPVRYSAEQAEQLQKNVLEQLTLHGERDILRVADSGSDGIKITSEIINAIPNITAFQNEQLNRVLHEQAALLLTEAQKYEVGTEVARIIPLDLKLSLPDFIIGTEGDFTVDIPKCSELSMILHNHPSGKTFSGADIDHFATDANAKIMAVVGNNGTMYILEKKDQFDWINFQIQTFDIAGSNDYADIILKGAESYGFRYHKI